MCVSVIISTVRATHLEATLASICRQISQDWEMIVVTQGNSPELKAFVERGHPDSRIRFAHLRDSGLSLARNAGLEAASHPIVLFTDDDCEAQEDWISVVTGCFKAHPDVWLVGGALVAPPRSRWQIAGCPYSAPAEVIYDPAETFANPPVGWDLIGGNFAIRREAYARIGPFDTFLGPGARFPVADDIDFVFRMEHARLRMLCTPRSVVRHTYGTRYGLRSLMKNSVNYARGNGAMAAKLTLMGDPRGAEWLQITRQEARIRQNLLYPHRFPFVARRVRAFEQAYKECFHQFCVNDRGLLQQISG